MCVCVCVWEEEGSIGGKKNQTKAKGDVGKLVVRLGKRRGPQRGRS